ncbi:hypothetical protein GYMLUDRAFT_38828 [Collybiopsis luxurians FD-317 M1]|nr:hypothetical protein GYMLUDRAFT_38828 [Collybiopsis luxurians FD-317 M1]
MIQAADWRSVSIVHNIPIPPEIKSILDGMTTGSRPSSKQSMPPLDRKSSGGSGGSAGSPPNKSSVLAVKSAASGATKVRPSGSPKSPTATLSKATFNPQDGRRETLDKEKSSPTSAHSSPSRKQIDLDANTIPRRNSAATSRPSLNKISSDTRPTPIKGTLSSTAFSQTPERRRSTTVTGSSHSASPSASKSSTPARSTSASATGPPRFSKKDDKLSSASSSSGGSDSLSDSTVTSDGGFTDYLSDESEAELQRQAEARAALLAQNQAEELEFKAARLQLTHVDLRPPKVWNSTNITNTTGAPRLTNATNRV